MENILISGGAGFIGSNLALKLVSLWIQCKCLIIFHLKYILILIENSQLYQSIKDKVNFINGDVRNRNDWQKAISNQLLLYTWRQKLELDNQCIKLKNMFKLIVVGQL